jgi:response regulator RpfG family c-di-GMP phosphodiesterase
MLVTGVAVLRRLSLVWRQRAVGHCAERIGAPMEPRARADILVVDDVRENLELLCSMLLGFGHEPRPVPNGTLAITAARSAPPDLVLLDVMMPCMDGYAVLHILKADPALQHIPVIMVSALEEQESAIRCIEEGADDYLTKPVNATLLRARVEAGLDRKHPYDEQRDLLERTLSGTVRVLAGLLSKANPVACARAVRANHLVRGITGRLGMESAWQAEVAALLSQLGCIDLPPSLLQSAYKGATLTVGQQTQYDGHPGLGSELLGAIPRLEEVCRSIRYQNQHFDGTGFPGDGLSGNALPLAARVLHVALRHDTLTESGMSPVAAVSLLASQEECYDPTVVAALRAALLAEAEPLCSVTLMDLEPGMVLGQDLVSETGEVLVPHGRTVTPIMKHRLVRMATPVHEPVFVRAAPLA